MCQNLNNILTALSEAALSGYQKLVSRTLLVSFFFLISPLRLSNTLMHPSHTSSFAFRLLRHTRLLSVSMYSSNSSFLDEYLAVPVLMTSLYRPFTPLVHAWMSPAMAFLLLQYLLSTNGRHHLVKHALQLLRRKRCWPLQDIQPLCRNLQSIRKFIEHRVYLIE